MPLRRTNDTRTSTAVRTRRGYVRGAGTVRFRNSYMSYCSIRYGCTSGTSTCQKIRCKHVFSVKSENFYKKTPRGDGPERVGILHFPPGNNMLLADLHYDGSAPSACALLQEPLHLGTDCG